MCRGRRGGSTIVWNSWNGAALNSGVSLARDNVEGGDGSAWRIIRCGDTVLGAG